MMGKRKACLTPTVSSDRGWILMYALVFCVVIQGIAMITVSLIAQNMKSGVSFQRLLSQRHIPAGSEEQPSFRTYALDPPEGWDHGCFLTEVTERIWGRLHTYSWRVRVREQPSTPAQGEAPVLSGWMPHIILLIDDSQDMLASCGRSYEEDRLYLEKPGNEIIAVDQRDDVETSISTSEGTCFRGGWGNAWHQADDIYALGGAMQCWTHVILSLKRLIDDLDMCPIAVATVSGGIVLPFTTDRAALFSSLEELRPSYPESRLSEALLNALDAFPDQCGTSKHIILATNGIAVHDGNIPSWLQDYDGDGNPLDRAVDEAGSHCLDDVASYASTRQIHVHVVGPDTPFLQSTAANGGGDFMPDADSFDPPVSLVSLPRCLYGSQKHFLTNTELVFGPAWLDLENTSYMIRMANTPPHLAPAPDIRITGCARSVFTDDGTLLCSTSRDHLLSIDLATGACNWIAQGFGGKVVEQDGTIIIGPDIRGDIAALDSGQGIRWLYPGELFAVSRGNVYIARGPLISSLTLEEGVFTSGYTADSELCAITYDPCQGAVLAASKTGLISILDQDLVLEDLFIADLPGTIAHLRPFRWKRQFHVIAVTESHAACMNSEKALWSVALEAGTCISAVVMDLKLYLSVWESGACKGIDTGSSALVVLDALTGETVSRTPLFEAKAFGPLIDPDAGVLEYASWDMSIHETDITDLPGILPVGLGERMTYDPGDILP